MGTTINYRAQCLCVLKIIILHFIKKTDQRHVSPSFPPRRECVYKSLSHQPLL
jgi:hypothetical protein